MKKSDDNHTPKYEEFLKFHRQEKIADVISLLIKCGTTVICLYILYLGVKELAGQNTWAKITVNFLGNIKVSQIIAWIFGGGGIIYGKSQNKLRKDTVEFFEGRTQSLEAQIDPNRSSSNLTQRGDTSPEDKK